MIGIMQGRFTEKGGFYPQQFPTDNWENEFYTAAENGVGAIEWMFNFDGFETNPVWTEEGRNRMACLMKETGVTVSSVCANYFMHQNLAENTDILKKLIKDMQSLNIKLLVLPLFENSRVDEIRNWEPVIRAVKEERICIALEMDVPAQRQLALISRLQCGNIGVCYDLGNAVGNGYNLKEEIEVLGSHMKEIHIKDKLIGGSSVMLGKGDVNFLEAADALRKLNYCGDYILESYFESRAVKDTVENLHFLDQFMFRKKWRFLFAGLGSAGQRHMRNLQRILGNDAEFVAYREQKLERVYDDNLQIEQGATLQEKFGLKVYEDFEKALDEMPDIVFITNPNSMHLPFAIKAAERGCHLCIEKPLSSEIEGVEKLRKIVKKESLICYIGYQNRFHPCIKRAKEYLEHGKAGKIISVHAVVGELLTSMHKYQDYTTMNESQKTTGGGVVLCQIHELDYLFYLFGLPQSVYSVGGKAGSWNIDVEDCAASLFTFESGEGTFSASVQQDYFQFPPTRKCQIIGTLGRIEFDLLENVFCFFDAEGKQEKLIFDGFMRNDLFISEMEELLSSVKFGLPEFVDIDQGTGSLKMALAVKQSFSTGKIVNLKG